MLIAHLANKNHWGKRATTLCALLFFSVLVQAATYTLPGGPLPAGCSSASGTSVTCPSLSLAWADTIVVSNANLTLAISNDLRFGGSNSINTSSTVAGFNITAQTVSASSNITLKGDITSTSTLTLSSNTNSITGNITAGGNVSIGGVLTGTLTTTGGLTPAYATTITGNISATSITSSGGSTYGASLTATSGNAISGSSDRITGNVSADNGKVTLKSATTVGGRVSAKNEVILESNATVTGSVTSTNDAVTLKSSGSSVGGGITAKKEVSIGSGCTVTGNITTDEDVKLESSSSKVIGNIVTKKKVELESSTSVTGSVTSTNDDVELKSSSASISSCVTAPSNKAIKLGWAATVGGVCCLSGSTCSTSCVSNNSGYATPGLCAAPAALVAEYRFEDTVYAGVAGEVKDSAGYTGGPFNGSVIGTLKPTAATASPVRTGACGYASLPGTTSNGGAFSLPNLPVSTTAKATTSVAFWMNWSGADSVMPMGWRVHDLWLVAGHFGFNTGASDVYGISSSGLANGWHHVMAVFTNGSVTNNQLYIDGVKQTLSYRLTTSSNLSTAVVSSTLQVGGWTNSTGYRFSGSIDELKVWKGTVTPAALAAGYANEAAGKRWDGTTQTCGSAPIADWRMDETTWNGTAGEVKDSSGNNRNGTAVNGPVPTGSGKVCAAGDFTRVNADQNSSVRDYVNVTNSTVDSLTAAVTVMGWVKPMGTVPLSWANAHYQYVFSNTRDVADAATGATYKGFELGVYSSQPYPVFRIWGADNAKYNAYGSLVTVGSWVHLAGTYDGQNVKLYINGTLAATTPYVGSIAAPASAGGTIGAMGMCKHCESNAFIDEVKVYDKALTAAQIAFGYSNENAGKNWDGTTRTCAVFPPTSAKPANFSCVEAGDSASTGRLYTKLAGTPFSVDVLALKADGSVETTYASDANKNVTVELVDGSGTTACASRAALNPAVSQTLTFATTQAGRKAAASITVPKAYADLRCRVTDANQSPSIVGCSADDFAVRPTGLTVTSNATADTAGASTSNTPIIKTGASFTLTAASGVVGYNYTPKIDTSKVAAHSGAVQAGTLAGSFGAANAANGTATGAAFTYSEVGYFNFSPNGVYDDTFTAVDSTAGDCIADFSNTAVGGKYGCKFSNAVATSYFGRFIPDHFTITAGALTQGCSAAFTYLGQDGFSTAFTIAAQNFTNTTTQNYTASFARLGLTAWDNFVFSAAAMPTGSALSASVTAPTGSWSNGSASVTAKHQVSRPTTGPVAPANVTISAKPVDSDGVTSASTTAVGGVTELRYGRLRMLNTYGSERLALAIPLQAQYYDATIGSFKHNTADSCTALSLPPVRTLSAAPPTDGVASRSFYPVVSGGNQLTSSDTTATLPVILSSGAANMTLTAPLKRGWTDIILNVPPYLQANWGNCWGQSGTAGVLDDMPCARATFGVYKSPLIYRRENY